MKLHSEKCFKGDIIPLCCCCFRVKTILNILRCKKTGLIAYGAVWVAGFCCCDVINQWLDVGMARAGEFLAVVGNY